MTEREFCYWLQGFLELNQVGANYTTFSKEQIAVIQEHLKLVFTKVTMPFKYDPNQGGNTGTPGVFC